MLSEPGQYAQKYADHKKGTDAPDKKVPAHNRILRLPDGDVNRGP
jgi:hypothetical protein